ncbi:MAG: hypothetical protein K2I30_02160 [Clostridia bacterium]|nr:hypothetical protein [Clostridia bacterium]
MKKILLGLLAITAISAVGAAAGCKKAETFPAVVVNGGFETGDLSGWTVEYGDAYDDDSVSSRKTFSYSADVDPQGYVIPVNQTGNWYLSGKGYDNKRPSSCTGAIRSEKFVLGGDGSISMKLAGGAPVTGRAETAPQKPAAEVCYVGVYRASDDKMIASQTNRYFAEDASNIDIADYENGTCYTDNFCKYTIDLSEYIGEELYIRVVDNDTGYYYGYLSVDDIRIGKDADAQPEGAYFTKTPADKIEERASEFDVINGGFETGNLYGWEVTDGRAFSHDGVNPDPYWWAEQIPYEREGDYHYGYYDPTATGRMRTVTFTLGGTGIITYKLGGCADNNTAYLRFMEEVQDGEDREILRVSNFAYKDMQFPNVQNGMRLINMTQYLVDFSDCLGIKMYIEAVDENASDNMAGCVVLDSVKTYHVTAPVFTDWYEVQRNNDEIIPQNEYQVKNGGFETGDLTDWTMEGSFGEVTSEITWWAEKLPYNAGGKYLFSGINNEAGTGTLTSSPFTVGGSGWMTFKFGGAPDPRFCWVALIDESGNEVAKYGNILFHNAGLGLINKGSNIYNMVTYRADLSEWMGQRLRIRIADYAIQNYGLVAVDSFVTYYGEGDINRFPANSFEAVNMLTLQGNAAENEFQVKNGSFELGTDDLGGWELNGNIGNISYDYLWWNEWYTFNKSGMYFFSGFSGNEGATGTLTSPAFTVGGSGMITYRLGGGMDNSLCYLEVVDADDAEKVYYRFANSKFTDKGGVYIGSPITEGCSGFGANMVLYKADLSKIKDKRVKLRLTDNATKDWGFLFADDFVTYYENAQSVPSEAVSATDVLPKPEFADVDVTLNFANRQSLSVTLNPKGAYRYYACTFTLVGETAGVSLSGNKLTVKPAEITENMNLEIPVTVKAEIISELTGERRTQTVKVSIKAINDKRLILNGGFETGDLTGWTYTVADGSSDFGRVENADYYWNNPENVFNKQGNYLFTGIETTAGNNQEAGRGTLRSSNFTLQQNGWISFMLGGAHNTHCGIRVRRAADNAVLAEFNNDGKGRDGAMDYYKYKFEGMQEDIECYIEIFDDSSGGWGLVVVDEICTYLTQEPEDAILIENCIA